MMIGSGQAACLLLGKATYDMAMILTQAGKPKPGHVDDMSAIPTIKRLKR